jgi:hypothetical protein
LTIASAEFMPCSTIQSVSQRYAVPVPNDTVVPPGVLMIFEHDMFFSPFGTSIADLPDALVSES